MKYNRICYFTNWGAHRSIKESRVYPEDIPADLCTHILYAFANLNGRSLQPQLANDIHVYQGEQVEKDIFLLRAFCLRIIFFLATLSTYYEIERKKFGFKNFNFLWWMGKSRRIRFISRIRISTVKKILSIPLELLTIDFIF